MTLRALSPIFFSHCDFFIWMCQGGKSLTKELQPKQLQSPPQGGRDRVRNRCHIYNSGGKAAAWSPVRVTKTSQDQSPSLDPHTPVSRLAKTFSVFSQLAGEGNAQSLFPCLLNVLISKLLLTCYLNLSRCGLDVYASYNTRETKKIKHHFLLLLLAEVETHLNIWDEMKLQHVQVSY